MSKNKDKYKNRKDHQPTEPAVVGLGRLFLGLLIIVIGASYLAAKFGLVNVNVGFILSHFWSLLIIWIGLSLVDARHKTVQIVGMIIVVVIVTVITFFLLNPPALVFTGPAQDFQITKVASSTSAVVNVRAGAVILKLGEQKTPADLASGKFSSDFWQLATSSTLEDGVQTIGLDTIGSGGLDKLRNLGRGGLNSLDLNLAADTLLDLNISSAAADLNIDLTKLKAENVAISTGASNLQLMLSTVATSSNVKISAGASTISITLPRDLGARFRFKSNLSSRNMADLKKIDTTAFNPNESIYETADFATAAKKAEVTLETGISRVEVKTN